MLTLVLAATATGNRESDNLGEITLTSPGIAEGGERISPNKADPGGVVWDNGMNYDGLLTSQEDPASDPPMDSRPADDFQFETDQIVADVHWIGGYWNEVVDGDFDWEITFYDDFGDGTKPGTEIYSHIFTNAEVNETHIINEFYSYSVDLGTPLSCLAGTKYWISIRGIGAIPPQSGWAYHETPITLHEAVIKSNYFGLPDWTNLSIALGVAADMCFQLTATPHKMHYPQYPDEDGWDVYAAYGLTLADDWECSQSGGVTDITFWGSWYGGNPGIINSFDIAIYSDIPVDPPSIPYSRPGTMLWSRTFYQDDWLETDITSPTLQGFYDPENEATYYDNHSLYHKYEISDIVDPFFQTNGTTYWLVITASTQGMWGWKSTEDHWNDDACWIRLGETDWDEMYEPVEGLIKKNYYFIGFDPAGNPTYAGGSDYYDDGSSFYGWYYYENYEWWNIWFYDHPFDDERYKTIDVKFWWYSFSGDPFNIEVAINWATDRWSLENPSGDAPPLPPLSISREDLYIGREIVPIDLQTQGEVTYSFTIPDYNPEWVSMDVRGYNAMIESGQIIHECLPSTAPSLDLAFIINTTDEPVDYGDAPDPTYPTLLASNGASHAITFGINLGNLIDGEADGQPTADAKGDDNNPLSPDDEDGVVFTTLVTRGEVAKVEVTASVPGFLDAWIDFNGDGDWDEVDDVIFASQALAAGINPLEFSVPAGAVTGATYSRFRVSSIGGLSYEGPADDGEVEDYRVIIVEPIEDVKIHDVQTPDLSSTGMDIAVQWRPLADDFLCMQSGPITDIHIWGSFVDDILPPQGGPGSMGFELAIYPDVPAGVNPNGPWSQPDLEPLWIWVFDPGHYDVTLVAEDNPEDWYDPADQTWINDNHLQAYQFDFYIDIADAFIQEEGTIYWLSVKPNPVEQEYTFGWKTAEYVLRWNDDATWQLDPPSYWAPLTYPVGHEYMEESLDLAFAITGSAVCDCRPGDADGTLPIDILDIVHLIDWKFKGCPPEAPIGTCPPPTPYPVCSGDADCNCIMDILDIVLMIDYKFKECPPESGIPCPPPCSCEDWVSQCGYPIYKK
jgi:hypothetical protein